MSKARQTFGRIGMIRQINTNERRHLRKVRVRSYRALKIPINL